MSQNKIWLRCIDPHAAWPEGLIKEFDEPVALELLKGPYYIKATDLDAYTEKEQVERIKRSAERLALVQAPCKSCKEAKEKAKRKRLGIS